MATNEWRPRVKAPPGEDGPKFLAEALQRVAAGDRSALEEVYRRTSPKLFGVCLRLLGSRAEAEETLQDVYLSVWRSAGMFNEARGSAMTWLLTLTRNRAVDHLRKTDRDARLATALAENPANIFCTERHPSEIAELNDEERRLAECLGKLQTNDESLIRTAFFEGLTYADLASRAALPLGTVKSRIRRGLLKVRECLE